MTYHHLPATSPAYDPAYRTLASFPIAAFSLTVLTDIAYWQTGNLLWLHFSEWLLFAGLVFGVLAGVLLVVSFATSRTRPSWLHALGGLVVLLLAALNSFIHTADGWTAVVPWGISTSILTVLAMIVTGWLGRRSIRHV